MKRILGVLCVMMSLCLLASCDNEDTGDLSDIALIVRPAIADSISLESGEKQLYTLEYYVNTGGTVKRLQIKSVDAEYGECILKDTTYTEPQDEATYMYVAPQSTKEKLRVKLTFTAWETTGKKTSQTRYVNVISKQVLMEELGPVVLYMATEKDDAIRFDAPTQTFCHSYTDMTGEIVRKGDLYLAVDTLDNNLYRLSFATATQASFVRANSLDYASTTSLAVRTVYENSIRSAEISDVKINDIIIVGHGTQAEGVLFVQNIVRQGTNDELCLQLRYKPLVQTTGKNSNTSDTPEKKEKDT